MATGLLNALLFVLLATGQPDSGAEVVQGTPVDGNGQDSMCARRLDQITTWTGNLRPLADLSTVDKLRRSTVVLLGESHDTQIQYSYPEIIKKIREGNPKINCLYFEMHKSNLPIIEAITRNPPSMRDSAQTRRLRQYEHLYGLGLKIMPVDNHWINDNGLSAKEQFARLEEENARNPNWDSLDERNKIMTTEIQKSLRDGTCTGGIVINGFKHLLSTNFGGGSLRDLLTNNQVPSASIMVVDSGCNRRSKGTWGDYDLRWRWYNCRENPAVVSQAGFASTATLEDLPVLQVKQDEYWGRWTDYDFALTAPPVSPEKCK